MPAREKNPVNEQDVLIVSDDGEFARDILSRWQRERPLPAFTLVTSEMCQRSPIPRFDVAIVGAVDHGVPQLLKKFSQATGPIIYVTTATASLRGLSSEQSSVTVLRRSEEWVEHLVLLAGEMLRRAADLARLRLAEHIASSHQRQAALGSYMQEMRHSFNNALTSLLGNAELILLNEDRLDVELREQIRTIHEMALNLHEMMQRFTSLEVELQCAGKEPKPELTAKVRAASSGSYTV